MNIFTRDAAEEHRSIPKKTAANRHTQKKPIISSFKRSHTKPHLVNLKARMNLVVRQHSEKAKAFFGITFWTRKRDVAADKNGELSNMKKNNTD